MEAINGRMRASRWVNVAAVFAIALIVVAVAAMLARGRPWEVLYVRWIIHVGPVGIAFTSLGWAILRRWPRHRLGAVFLVDGLVAAVHVAALSFADARFVAGGVGSDAALRFTPRDLPLSVAVPYWLSSWLWLLVAATSIVLVLLLFPDGHLPSRRWWPVVAATVFGTVLLITGFMVWTWPGSPHERVINEQPSGIPIVSPLVNSGWVVILIALVAAIASLGVRLRDADVHQRRQLRPVVVSGALLGVVTVALFPGNPCGSPRSSSRSPRSSPPTPSRCFASDSTTSTS